jgi:short-subunit dehydrogenase
MNKGNVLITGASSGIGEALAYEQAKLGWNLILVARRVQELERTRLRCLQINSALSVQLITADVAQEDFISVLKNATTNIKDLKIVYVNAGVGAAGRFEKLQMKDYKRVFDINVMGALQTIYGSFDALKIARGRIVLLGSLNSYLALPLGAPYNMSKFAIRALAETLDAELVNSGIQTSIVYPGPVHTSIVATDNQGRPNPEAKDYFSKKPALTAEQAAQRIVRGVLQGRRSFSLTASSSLVLWFQQRFPGVVAFVMRWAFAKFEKQFVELVAKVNPDAV